MLERVLNLLQGQQRAKGPRWLTSDIAVGTVADRDAWQGAYDGGVRAIVDLHNLPEDQGGIAREHGMRYLHLCLRRDLSLSAEELQIVTGWILDRTAEGGRVLIQDAHARFNDGLVAVASLIKRGMPAHLALLALRRAVPDRAFDEQQNAALVWFATRQAKPRG